MSIVKRIVLYLIVGIISAGICILFVKVFYFEKYTPQRRSFKEVDEQLIQELYEYIPKELDAQANNFYAESVINYTTLNHKSALIMLYNYISKNQSLSQATTNELDALKITDYDKEYTAYKINITDFEGAVNKVFGNVSGSLTLESFIINYETYAKLSGDTFYIYHISNPVKEYVTYTGIVSYSTQDNNDTIVIEDYYLKCSVITKKCYNDSRLANPNNNITYSENMDIKNYIPKLKTYEHTFRKEKNSFYWGKSNKKKVI